MANDYFNLNDPLTRHTLGRAEQVNQLFQAVSDAFDKLPSETKLNQGGITYVADTGAANSYVVALPTAPSAYVAGLTLTMKAANDNTAASVINVNSLGVKPIKRYNGDPLEEGDILTGMLVHLGYDGTNFRIIGAHGAEAALAKTYSEAAATSASNAATSEANAEGHYQAFRNNYFGALASDPGTKPSGGALASGDWYFNTTTAQSRIWDGSVWADIGSAASLSTFIYTASGGETSLTGADDDGRVLAYTAGIMHLHRNGALLTPGEDYTATDGSSITGLAALTAGDVVVISAFTPFDVIDVLDSVEVGSSTGSELLPAALDKRVIKVTDIKDLANITPVDGLQCDVREFWPGTGFGSKLVEWNSSKSKTEHDGGYIIDPGKITELGSTGVFNSYFTPAASGSGCWVMVLDNQASVTIRAKDYGVLSTSTKTEVVSAIDKAISAVDSLGGGIVIIDHDLQYGYSIGDATTYPNMKNALNNLQVIDYSIGNSSSAPGYEDGSQIRHFFHTPNIYDGTTDGNGFMVIGDYHPYIGIDNSANLAPPGDPSRTVNDNRRASVVFKSDGIVQWMLGQGVNVGTSYTDEEMLDFRGAMNGVPDFGDVSFTKWLQVSKQSAAVGFNAFAFSKTNPYEFGIREGFATGNCIFRGTDVDPYLRLISDNGEAGLRRTASGLELRIDNADCYTVSENGATHKIISGSGSLGLLYQSETKSRRFFLNDATGEFRWQNLALSANTMVHDDTGNLTITGAYSPFTGVHVYRSSEDIEVGCPVDLMNAERKEFTVDDGSDDGKVIVCEGLVTPTVTANSKICAGIVESCFKVGSEYIVTVAQVGDNRTHNLHGFKVNDTNGPVEAGDILVTSGVVGELMKASDGLPESVVRFKAMTAPDDNGVVYGYFK